MRLLEDEPITALLLEDFLENVGFSVRRIPIPEEIAMDLSEERDVDLEPLTLLDVEYEGPHYKPSSRPLFPLALSKRNPYIFREVLGDVSDFATNDFWLALGKFAGHVASVGVFLKSHRV
ncbi:MAG: hypothetical protein D6696_10440 [Acidobacteria bacterium]|nr:MAG: hypothetical protein D6696_10440 [Acidobacteriota bacterium]